MRVKKLDIEVKEIHVPDSLPDEQDFYFIAELWDGNYFFFSTPYKTLHEAQACYSTNGKCPRKILKFTMSVKDFE